MTTYINLELKRFSRYAAIGLGSNLTLYLLFLVMVWADLGAVSSSVICYIFGVTLSYLLNRKWTFASSNAHRQDLPRFLAAYATGFGATLLSINALVAPLGPALAQLVTIGVAAGVIYMSLRLLNFGTSR